MIFPARLFPRTVIYNTLSMLIFDVFSSYLVSEEISSFKISMGGTISSTLRDEDGSFPRVIFVSMACAHGVPLA